MRSLELLSHEHELLKSLVCALESVAARLDRDPLEAAPLLDRLLVEFGYHVEGVHMAKEEQVLFPYLEAHGLDRSAPVVGALAHQHEAVKVHGRRLRALCERLRGGDQGVRSEIVLLTHDFIALFREHMRIEESYFYSLADRIVPPDDDASMMERFLAIDRVSNAEARRAATREMLARQGWG